MKRKEKRRGDVDKDEDIQIKRKMISIIHILFPVIPFP